MSTTQITAGFLPLLDSILLVLAREKGFAEDEGLGLTLVRETSWANIRDRAALGHFDIAQMLAPMPLATSLGLTPLAMPMIAPVVLGLGNNAVTVSDALWRAMADQGAPDDLDPTLTGAALAKAVQASPRKLRFGVVHQTSSHNYELRYWLASSGIVPDRDIEIVVLPPPLLPDALGAGGIDGYCVGEPWNSIGVATKGGHIATAKALIWRSSPDKVVGMRETWAADHPDLVAAIIRAVYRAGLWCAEPDNRSEAAAIMAGAAYLNASSEIVGRALTGTLDIGGVLRQVPDYYIPHASAANFPWKSHALWYYSQMVRWGEVPARTENAAVAAACFRPDLYRSALAPLGVAVPDDDYKIDGLRGKPGKIVTGNGSLMMGADLFFDGQIFDPSALDSYIASQTARG
ncbi:CmpA/NrtA family ABC transporter substrate-binding protein [Devosia lacusdianchii]|uniref:CmpA/NrtA family ABC transporter substrate-binding protein n=1 Tax=Devosia lacusdianchii TaxID=2917991 RepID=UPI001F067C73|nr:CmpA/NrtA family ABC transporter substrate-binding protein [Devosia sp. JXJ CY 41]